MKTVDNLTSYDRKMFTIDSNNENVTFNSDESSSIEAASSQSIKEATQINLLKN